MTTNYDVMILGTGEAGIYAAYELALKCPSARVLVVDQGADIYRRSCPIVQGMRHHVRLRRRGGLFRREI